MDFGLWPLLQVVLIDVVLAGDNAIIIAALASGLPAEQRTRAMGIGIGFAIIARLFFTLSAAWLLMIPGIAFVGGLLLLWIGCKLAQDTLFCSTEDDTAPPSTSFAAAVRAIVVADVSMSLDNVLGVAGAAQGHVFSLIVGLILSMVLMGGAAGLIAKAMQRHRWIIWVGIVAIFVVALRMIWSVL